MVFDDDVCWQRDYIAHNNVTSFRAGENVRFRSWGTEHLLVRCVRAFMPFVRTIYIILARKSQRKPWMDGKDIKIVYHKDFIPAQYLPVFNSCTIEMFLPYISGLSEYFIYGNDDVFPLSPLKISDFFVDGKPVQHLSPKDPPLRPNVFQSKCLRQQTMVANAFGKSLCGVWLKNGHGLSPLLKSSCIEAREHFSREITSGITKQRSTTSYNQYLYVLWQYFTGKYVDGRVQSTYVSVKSGTSHVAEALRCFSGVLCINDNEYASDISSYASIAKSAIEKRLLGQSGTTPVSAALIAIGRLENEYAREFVEHHLSLGFSRVIIADNNYDGEEFFEDVLGDYISEGSVIIENFRGKPHIQCLAYNLLYEKYNFDYDWLAFFDFDEMLVINEGRTFSEWLSSFPSDADEILVNWKIMTDGSSLENDGRPMIERFSKPMDADRCVKYRFPENNHCKCLLRGGLGEACFSRTPHSSDSSRHCYSASGIPCRPSPFLPYDHSVAMLLHFTTKTIGEWMRNKWKKGVGTIQGEKFRRRHGKYFFSINERTPEKVAYMEAFERNMSERLVACIVHYNTPELTMACIRSLWKHTPGCYVLIFDNSDRRPFPYRLSNVEVIDNTRGQKIDFNAWLDTFPSKRPSDNNYASAKHCYSVQWLIDHRRRPFLLMDSDVLIKQDVAPLFDRQYVYVGEEKMHKSRFGDAMRVLPFLCYIDVPLVRKYGISYYSRDMMYGLSDKSPNSAYDTGCWFYADCRSKGLSSSNISVSDYALHFGHGSWKDKDAHEWLSTNEHLWR